MCDCEWYLVIVFEAASCFLFLNDIETFYRVPFDVLHDLSQKAKKRSLFCFYGRSEVRPMTAACSLQLTEEGAGSFYTTPSLATIRS